jgi:hypothetical protein
VGLPLQLIGIARKVFDGLLIGNKAISHFSRARRALARRSLTCCEVNVELRWDGLPLPMVTNDHPRQKFLMT